MVQSSSPVQWLQTPSLIIKGYCTNQSPQLPNICPWAMNLSGLSKRGGGWNLRVVIFLSKNTPISHAVSLAPIYECMQWLCNAHELAYAITANGVCLHSLVHSKASLKFLAWQNLVSNTDITQHTAKVRRRTLVRRVGLSRAAPLVMVSQTWNVRF